MKKVKTASGLIILLALIVMIGCSGSGSSKGSGGDLLGDAKISFLGDSTANEFPTRSTQVGDRITISVRYGGVEGVESARLGDWLQGHSLDGTELWAVQVEQGIEIAEMIEVDGDTGLMLIRLRADDGTLAGVEIWEFDGNTGTVISQSPIPWNTDFAPWAVYSIPDNRYLVLGAKQWGHGEPYLSHGVIVNADGSKYAEWPTTVTNLFPIEGGFLGVRRMPGGRLPDAELMRVGFDGEVVWHNEKSDTLFNGIVMGATQTSDGDIIFTAQDRSGVQPVIVRVDYDDGAVRWVKRPEELNRLTCYNPLPWGTDEWLVGVGEMKFGDGKSWNSVGAVTINADGEILSKEERTDFWMIPTLIQSEIEPGKAVMVGIGSSDFDTFPKVTDVAWLTIGVGI
jgi:hypothetical protein